MKTISICFWLFTALFTISASAFSQTIDLKSNNDSAQFYLEINQTQKAYSFIQKNFQLKPNSSLEFARSYLLLAQIYETEGYVSKALANFRNTARFANQTSSNHLLASALCGVARSLVALDHADSVLWYCDESLKLDSGVKNKIHNNLTKAHYWKNNGQNDKAMHYCQSVFDLAKSSGDKKSIGLVLSEMGSIYFNQYGDMDQALNFYRLALNAFDSSKHANLIAHTYTRMANALMVQEKGKEASSYLDRAKTITDVSGNLPVKAYMLSSLAILKTEGGNMREVIQYAEEALQIKRQLGVRRKLQNDLLNLGSWYIELKQYAKAKQLLAEGLALAYELNDITYLHYFYESIAQLDSLTGNFSEAYSHLKRANHFKDSAYSIQKIKAVEEIGKKYENEQKEKTIAENELLIQKQKYQQSVIIGISAVTLLFVITVLLWRLNQQGKRFHIEQERQNKLNLQAIVHTQEEVQQRIARDIHDGLVQVMGAAKLSLQAINIQGDKEVIFNRIKDASVILDEACTEARNISHQILPYSLMKGGLLPALEELFKKSLSKLEYRFDHDQTEIRFNQNIEINLYRITQELVQNILKHSEATRVDIRMDVIGNTLILDVCDNGKGFDQFVIHGNAGLTNMKARAQLMGTSLTIDTKPGGGTKVNVQVIQ